MSKEKKMQALVEGKTKKPKLVSSRLTPHKQARTAIQRPRQVMGTFIYMQHSSVSKMFATEKKRVGEMLGFMDKELHKAPRIYDLDDPNQKGSAIL